MEEKNYKIYDSLYNVIGVAPYEEVHTKGLLHQVVHFWLAEKKENQLWFYLQKRADNDIVYKGAYDILTSGHIDPEETHEEAMVHQIKEQLGVSLQKEQLTYIGHIHQQIKKGTYFDNAFVQSYLYVTDHAEKDFAEADNVVKVKFEELVAFVGDLDKKVAVYTTEGKLIEETTHDQWWLRDEEFEKVVEPYIKEHFAVYRRNPTLLFRNRRQVHWQNLH